MIWLPTGSSLLIPLVAAGQSSENPSCGIIWRGSLKRQFWLDYPGLRPRPLDATLPVSQAAGPPSAAPGMGHYFRMHCRAHPRVWVASQPTTKGLRHHLSEQTDEYSRWGSAPSFGLRKICIMSRGIYSLGGDYGYCFVLFRLVSKTKALCVAIA